MYSMVFHDTNGFVVLSLRWLRMFYTFLVHFVLKIFRYRYVLLAINVDHSGRAV
jgi:hypothetical protein